MPTGGGAAGGRTVGGESGGGVDAGPGRCVKATDCQGSPSALGALCVGTTGAWSCALGQCVVECGAGRTCTEGPTLQCLSCSGTQSCTDGPSCPFLTDLVVEQSTCGLASLEQWRSRPTTRPCERTVLFADGGVAGTVWAYASGSVRGEFPSLGGSCLGQVLPTGAVHFSLSCPSCSAIVRLEIVGP
jgi:hypothetical protein